MATIVNPKYINIKPDLTTDVLFCVNPDNSIFLDASLGYYAYDLSECNNVIKFNNEKTKRP